MDFMKFTKMHGNGNDFIVIDDLDNRFVGLEEKLAVRLCRQHFGIGADGILLVRKSNCAKIQMVIINADGSYASMCGNGIRCFAKYVYENKLVHGEAISIETGDGVKTAFLKVYDGEVTDVTINMGSPSFNPDSIPASTSEKIINRNININGKDYTIDSMMMGVPHTIVFGKLDKYAVEEGKGIEKYSLFPKGTNVNFCEVINNNKIEVKTWERGAGPTLACGTGSCACVVACLNHGYTCNKVEVNVPGGILVVEVTDEGVMMTGPAIVSFTGEVSIDGIL
jgi:diaminopimelate epimerase